MAVNKKFNTRVQLKYDTLANWTSSSFVPLRGEVCIAEIPENAAHPWSATNPPQVLIKVGDGSHTFSQLDFISAKAADVYAWAKNATVTGAPLTDYVAKGIITHNESLSAALFDLETTISALTGGTITKVEGLGALETTQVGTEISVALNTFDSDTVTLTQTDGALKAEVVASNGLSVVGGQGLVVQPADDTITVTPQGIKLNYVDGQNGLTFESTHLGVKAGNGIEVTNDGVTVKPADYSIDVTSDGVAVNTEAIGLNDLSGRVATNETNISTISTDLADEITRAKGEESTLSGLISAEETRAKGVEEDLSDAIAQEVIDRDAAISAAVQTLDGSATIATATDGVVTIKGGITETDGVISNSGTDVTLAKVATTGKAEDVALDNEEAGFNFGPNSTVKEAILSIDAETETLDGKIDAETERAEGVEAILSAQISALSGVVEEGVISEVYAAADSAITVEKTGNPQTQREIGLALDNTDANDYITLSQSATGLKAVVDAAALSTISKNYTDAEIQKLDVDNITGFGEGKTLATLTETDGKIAATFQDIKITSDKVTDSVSAGTGITSTETKLVQAKAVNEFVASEIAKLDSEESSTAITAGHVVTGVTVKEVDGKIDSVTVTDAQLSASQVAYDGQTGTFVSGSDVADVIYNMSNSIQGRFEYDESALNTEIANREAGDQQTLSDAIAYTDAQISAEVSARNVAISAAIETLDSAGADLLPSETIDQITEVNGVITVSKQTIAISSDQVTDAITQASEVTAANANKLVESQALSAYVKEQIKDLEGALHFRGVKTSTTEVTDPKTGDVVVLTNGKEFIYDGTTWREIGDEGLYVQKSQTIAGIDQQDAITATELRNALIAAGSAISFTIGCGESVNIDVDVGAGLTVGSDRIDIIAGNGIGVTASDGVYVKVASGSNQALTITDSGELLVKVDDNSIKYSGSDGLYVDTAAIGLNDLSSRMGSAEADIDALEGRMGSAEASISQIGCDLANEISRATTAENALSVAFDGKIAALNGSAGIASVGSDDIITLKTGITETSGVISNDSGSDITLAKVAKTGLVEDLDQGEGEELILFCGTASQVISYTGA